MLIPFLRDSKYIFPYFFRPNNEHRSDLRSSPSALSIFRALLMRGWAFNVNVRSILPSVQQSTRPRQWSIWACHIDGDTNTTQQRTTTTTHPPPMVATAHHCHHNGHLCPPPGARRVHHDDGFAENAASLGHQPPLWSCVSTVESNLVNYWEWIVFVARTHHPRTATSTHHHDPWTTRAITSTNTNVGKLS